MKATLDVRASLGLRGILIIIVVVAHVYEIHFAPHINLVWWLSRTVSLFYTSVNALLFFLSAFGLMTQYQKRGRPYLNRVLFVKFPFLLCATVLASMIWYYTYGIINTSLWFIYVLLALYLIFALTLYVFNRLPRTGFIALCIAVVVFIAPIALRGMFFYLPLPSKYPHLTLLPYYGGGASFLLGLIFARFNPQIAPFLDRFFPFVLVLLALIATPLFIFDPILLNRELFPLLTCIFVATLCTRVRPTLLAPIGRYSLYIYLTHVFIIVSILS